MFQALEAFDRRDVVYTPEQEEKHRERVSQIAKAVEDRRDRDWVKGRLRRLDEPQAKERIHRLVEKYDAAWVFDDAAQEIQLAADFRNFYTHYDPKYVSMLPDLKEHPLTMHNLAVRFQALCEVVLLREVGFPAEQLKRRFQETQRLQRRLGRERQGR
jgi:hypothetical protein